MTTKMIKLRIKSPIDDDWDDLGEALRETRYAMNKIKNISMQYFYHFDFLSYENKLRKGEYLNAKDIFEKNLSSEIYSICSKQFDSFYSTNIVSSIRNAELRYKQDKRDLMNGNVSLATFRRTGSFEISNQEFNIYEKNGKIIIRIPIYSKKASKDKGRKNGRFTFEVFNTDNSTRTIISRILSGEYKKGSAKIAQDKKGKWFINVSYTFENPRKSEPKTGGIMGIDLGISKALYIAFDKSKARYYIDGGEIEAHRKKVEAMRNSIYRGTKWAGKGRKGRGRKKLLEPAQKMSDKVSNFRDTINHKYSRFVIDMAIKHNVHKIQMEDLSGIGNLNAFLKNWSYYDLQEKITYKAKEVGIEVEKIKPDYTSQRCHECGHIEKGNRENQSTFKCCNCGAEHNADYNAAKNISIDGIEEIISSKKKRGEKKEEALTLF